MRNGDPSPRIYSTPKPTAISEVGLPCLFCRMLVEVPDKEYSKRKEGGRKRRKRERAKVAETDVEAEEKGEGGAGRKSGLRGRRL